MGVGLPRVRPSRGQPRGALALFVDEVVKFPQLYGFRPPVTTKLESYLRQYIEALEATAIEDGSLLDPKAWTFPTAAGRSGRLSNRPMGQADVYRMIRRRALDAGIETKIGCHSFRATGITEYLRNGGKLEVAQQMANHELAMIGPNLRVLLVAAVGPPPLFAPPPAAALIPAVDLPPIAGTADVKHQPLAD